MTRRTASSEDMLATARAVGETIAQAFRAAPPLPAIPRPTPLQLYRQYRIGALAAGVEWLLSQADCPDLRRVAASAHILAGELSFSCERASDLEQTADRIMAELARKHAEADAWLRDRLAAAAPHQVPGLLLKVLDLGEAGFVETQLATLRETDPFAAEHVRIKVLTAQGRTYEAARLAERCHEEHPDRSIEAGIEKTLQYRQAGGATAGIQPETINSAKQLKAALATLTKLNELPRALALAAAHLPLLQPSVGASLVALRVLRPIAQEHDLPLIEIRQAMASLPPHHRLVALRHLAFLTPAHLSELAAQSADQPALHPHATEILNEALAQAVLRMPWKAGPLQAQAEVLALCHALRSSGRPSSTGSGAWRQRVETQRRVLQAWADYEAALDAGPAGLEQLTTPRARQFFEAVSTSETGALLVGNHLSEASGRITYLGMHAVAALSTRKVLSILQASSQHRYDLARHGISGPNGDSNIALLGLFGMEDGQQIEAILGHLKRGDIIDVTNDGLQAPGVRALVPWLERPYAVRVFPAQVALAANARVGLRLLSAVTPQGPMFDVIEVRAPRQGSLWVRSLWLTQKLARQIRCAHAKGLADCSSAQLRTFGGPPAARQLLALETWRDTPEVQASLLKGMRVPAADREATAEFETGRLISQAMITPLALRMVSLLLHFQANAPEHSRRDRRFLEQHRMAVVAPRGEVLMATAFGALAAGSLLCPLEDDLAPTALIERLKAFRPDLILAPASVWTRMVNADRDLQKAPVLIFDDAGDLRAAEDLLESFTPATALPAFAPHQPGFVVFTSGSEGRPKGVVVPAGLQSNASGLDRCMQLSSADRVLYMTRWDAVGLADLMACLRAGAQLALPDREIERSPVALAHWIEQAQATFLSAPVSIWRLLLKTTLWQRETATSLRQGLLWGEPITRGVMSDLARVRPALQAWCAYDSSEVVYTAFGKLPDAAWPGMTGSPGGWVAPDTTIEIRPDGSTEDPNGGTLRVTSPKAMLGYFDALADANLPVKERPSREVMLQDILRQDAHGRIEVLGRRDAVFKLAGQRFSIRQFEKVCEQIDGIGGAIGFLETSRDVPELSMALQIGTHPAKELVAQARSVVFEASAGALKLKQVKTSPEFPVMASGKTDRGHIKATFSEGCHAPLCAPTTLALPELPPVLSRLRDWAKACGLVEATEFDPAAPIPELTSLERLELSLVVEEIHEAHLNVPPALPSTRQSWSDFARCLEDRARPGQLTAF